MRMHARRFFGKLRVVFAATAIASLAFGVGAATAQQAGIYAPGEPIITGFSGFVPPDPAPTTGDPLDKTFIDLGGNSMVIQQLQPNGPPAGQLIPSPPVFTAKAKDVGQVFGIALDNAPDVTDAVAPNIYLAGTSAFGLDLVVPDKDGTPIRTKVGAPGAAFMAGQWGTAGGVTGTPGSIWKVDGTTGQISLFSTIAANSGAGLGNIVFDAATQEFFVSDLDTGLIYRLDSTGTILDTFDHGENGRPAHGLAPVADDGSEIDITNPAFNTEDPKTWGFTQPERKVYGLSVHDGRLYYAVADGPQIWSIGINLDGTFAGDPRWELDVQGLPSTNEITNIVFDNQGRMILAQRGPQVGSYDYTVFADPKTSSVVRYTRELPDDPATPSAWIETPDSYAIGFRPDGQNTTGGLALGYGYDPKTQTFGGACSDFLWTTGESLRDNPTLLTQLGGPAQVHGLQGNDHNLVRPANDPPVQSYFTDYDGNTDDSQAAYQGHVGDVDIWQKCEGGYIGFVPPPSYVPPPSFNLTLHKIAVPPVCYDARDSWICGYDIRVTNTAKTVYWGPINVDDWLPNNDPGAKMAFAPQPFWKCDQVGSTEYQCGYPPVELFPGESIDLHERVILPKRERDDLCWLDNGASIFWPLGVHDGDPTDDQDFASARIPSQHCLPPTGHKTNLRIQKIAYPQTCAQDGNGWDCTFFVRVTNTGPGDYNAPIEVKDTLGLTVPATVIPSPPWSCGQVGATLTCDLPTTLLHPGQFRQFEVKAIVPHNYDRPVCRLPNSADIIKAPGGTDLNFDPSDDHASAVAIIPDRNCDPNTPRTDLSLKKTALGCIEGPSSLVAQGPGGYICRFEIEVKNEGPGAFNGPISIHDVMTPAIPAASVHTLPGGICSPSGSGGFDCNSPGNVALAAGGATAFYMFVNVPANSNVCRLSNTAEITNPTGGSAMNTNPLNDKSSAVDTLPSQNCNNPPPTTGRTDLSLTKTRGECSALRALVTDTPVCFDVTIKNEGPSAYNGPIDFTDTPSVPATGFNGFPNLSCSASGGGYDCSSAGAVSLAVGASVTYHVVTSVSSNGQICRVPNRAQLTQPAGGTASNTNPANDSGFAVAPVVNASCTTPQSKPQCSIQQRMPDGSCCPDGQNWNGQQCGPTPPRHQPPVQQCGPHSSGDVTNCVCDNGYHMDRSGQCLPNVIIVPTGPVCGPNSSGLFPNCTCDPGFFKNRARQCVPEVPVHQICGAHSLGNYPDCVCDRGYTKDRSGQCQPVVNNGPTGPQCGAHSSGTYPDCTCDRGYTKDRAGQCILLLNNGPQCGAHSSGTYPDCTCDSGYQHTTSRTVCVPLISRFPSGSGVVKLTPDAPKACPSDSVGTSPDCVCKTGTHGRPGHCAPDQSVNTNVIKGIQNTGPKVMTVNPGLAVKVCPKGTVGKYPRCLPLESIRPGMLLNRGPANEVIH